MGAWIPFTLERLFPKEIEQAASAIVSAASVVAQLLSTIATIIDIIAALILGFVDALAAALNALIQAIKNALKDLLAMGFYACFHYPSSWKYEDWKSRKFLSPSRFVQDLANSFDDGLDPERPQFSNDAYVAGLVLMFGAPTFADLWALLLAFIALFKWDFEMPEPSKPSENRAQPGDGLKPNWHSTNLSEWLPPLKEIVDDIIAFLDSLTILNDIAALLRAFAEFIRKKAQKLKEFAERLKALLEALAKALKQTGIYALPILGQGGNELLKSALRNVSGVPSDVTTTDEQAAEDMANAMQGALDAVNRSWPDQSEFAPENRDRALPDWKESGQDAQDQLDQFNDQYVDGEKPGFLQSALGALGRGVYADEMQKFWREFERGPQDLGSNGVSLNWTSDTGVDVTPLKARTEVLLFMRVKDADKKHFWLSFRRRDTGVEVCKWRSPGKFTDFQAWADAVWDASNPDHGKAVGDVEAATTETGFSDLSPSSGGDVSGGSPTETLSSTLGSALSGGEDVVVDGVNLGERFAPTDFPDFGGADAFACGMMLVTGGPSEAAARVLLDLFGVAPTMGATAAAGGTAAYANAANMDNVVNNYPKGQKEAYQRGLSERSV